MSSPNPDVCTYGIGKHLTAGELFKQMRIALRGFVQTIWEYSDRRRVKRRAMY
jgi:hypothetical protein